VKRNRPRKIDFYCIQQLEHIQKVHCYCDLNIGHAAFYIGVFTVCLNQNAMVYVVLVVS